MEEAISTEKITLAYLNPHITCNICHGYLIDAVSITECLHQFCKSCIVKYLTTNNTCPVCEIVIHQSYPLNYISADRTLQDIVYKLVPNLKEVERQNRVEFYRSIGQSPPACEDLIHECKASSISHASGDPNKTPQMAGPPPDPNFHRNDEPVHIKLEPGSDDLRPLERKFLRISSKATVTHLRKFIALNILNDTSKFNEVDIFIMNCDKGTFLGRDHALKFVQVVYWNSNLPMPLEYRYSTKMK